MEAFEAYEFPSSDMEESPDEIAEALLLLQGIMLGRYYAGKSVVEVSGWMLTERYRLAKCLGFDGNSTHLEWLKGEGVVPSENPEGAMRGLVIHSSGPGYRGEELYRYEPAR